MNPERSPRPVLHLYRRSMPGEGCWLKGLALLLRMLLCRPIWPTWSIPMRVGGVPPAARVSHIPQPPVSREGRGQQHRTASLAPWQSHPCRCWRAANPPSDLRAGPASKVTSAGCAVCHAPRPVQLGLPASRAAQRFPTKRLICKLEPLWKLQAAGKLLQLRVRWQAAPQLSLPAFGPRPPSAQPPCLCR